MAALNEIIRTDRSTFDTIAAGTHATETYNDNNEYQVELDEPIELGATSSGMKVDTADNKLKLDADGTTVMVNADNTVSAAIPNVRYLT